MEKDKVKLFFDEIKSRPPNKNYTSDKIRYTVVDQIWSIDLMNVSDYKTTKTKAFRHIFVIINNFLKYAWCTPLKNKNADAITDAFSKILYTLKRKTFEIESDRGTEIYTFNSQNCLRVKSILQCSRFTDKGPSIVERVFRTIRNFF